MSHWFNPDFTHKPLTAIQLYKYIQAVVYNIEPEHWQLSDQEKQDLELLKKWETSLAYAIVMQTEEYKKAAWSD